MLGRKYSTETVRYFDLVSNYVFLPQKTTEECICIAKAFLLHLLGAYLFANGGQTGGPAASEPIDPPHLPWTVSAYGIRSWCGWPGISSWKWPTGVVRS
ncbi:hypothetical protein SO802_017604 [Lithocarpus litseifolius]|uniref:Uncharacterized protein n=1 Tax=Lithocarpus litseifolius TaxID=425828 RepID=A0AAW2CIS1_9ROSI